MEERNFKPEKAPNHYLQKVWIKVKQSFSHLIHEKNHQTRVLMLGNFLGTIAVSSAFIAIPLFFTEVLNLTPEYVAGLYGIVSFVTILSPIFAEKFAHKVGLRNAMIPLVLIVGFSIIGMGFANSLIYGIIFFLILKLGLGAVDVIEDSAMEHSFDSKIRASLGSLSSITWTIADSIAVFFAGILIAIFGPSITLIFSGCFALVETIAYFIGLEKD